MFGRKVGPGFCPVIGCPDIRTLCIAYPCWDSYTAIIDSLLVISFRGQKKTEFMKIHKTQFPSSHLCKTHNIMFGYQMLGCLTSVLNCSHTALFQLLFQGSIFILPDIFLRVNRFLHKIKDCIFFHCVVKYNC